MQLDMRDGQAASTTRCLRMELDIIAMMPVAESANRVTSPRPARLEERRIRSARAHTRRA